MRFLFTLQYFGTRYAGWQRQANHQFILRREAPKNLWPFRDVMHHVPSPLHAIRCRTADPSLRSG